MVVEVVSPSCPQLFLISRPTFDRDGMTRFLEAKGVEWSPTASASDAELVVEASGRLCYLSFTSDESMITSPNRAYIRNLIVKGHDSVLEHAVWTFFLTKISRAFTHQLVRHRIGFSYSQLSQQYHDESEAEFIVPAGMPLNAYEKWRSAMQSALFSYREILSGVDAIDVDVVSNDVRQTKERVRLIRSSARSLLPNATETAISVTANARALRHFLDLRGAILGDVEMRLVSMEIFKMLEQEAPALVQDYALSIEVDGFPLVRRVGLSR